MNQPWKTRVEAEQELDRLSETPAGVKEIDRWWFSYCGPGTGLGTIGGTTPTRIKQLLDALYPKYKV
jgi:hypothetical protein